LRRLVRDMLRDHGYRVLEAGCPIEALDVCERNANQIDLILTDVMMPSMSGRHFADVARESHGIRHVAYISGYDDHSLMADGVLLGTARLLQKPFLEADLLRFVRQALDS
ncbi:MAG TPA: response regulator, partial [Polyangiaceae bacterium]